MSQPSWKLDAATAAEALRLLAKARLVLMPMHQNVDADGLSSPLAVMHALRQQGVDAVPLISDGVFPANLAFLPGIEDVLVYGKDELPDYDVLCLVDCADRKRLGSFYTDDPDRVNGAVPIVNIDHHVTNDRFGVVNIVEAGAASASEVVTDILAAWGTELTAEIAQCLLAGIYGDTLGLRTESTTSRTMRTAADLVDAGANTVPIVDALFRLKPKSSVCLWERGLQKVKWTGSVIWTELTTQEFDACGAAPVEAEGMVNFLVGTEGSRVAAILYANDRGWRVSMRSMATDVDVSAIAAQFGGGGHPRAAGCTIEGDESARNAFLERVAELAGSVAFNDSALSPS
ncbi:MAG: RecJ [uncultured Thermomicrobiales bacterium]|uniref:RecJ n=1 Tax=uncultured Thermomicrobiales bacterium TaxID=1645740 RepID=A0A6J4UYL8_9BACT|nr:MAG: RecJ [uncultured Thermomicrobiales bacterium]